MDFSILHRCEGKTHLAVEWLKADAGRRVLLTASEVAAADVRKRYGLNDRQVMSYRSARLRLRGRRSVEIAVDNLDCILADLLGTGSHPIALVTATGTLSGRTLESAEA